MNYAKCVRKRSIKFEGSRVNKLLFKYINICVYIEKAEKLRYYM